MDMFYDNINIINILIVHPFIHSHMYIDFMLFNYVARDIATTTSGIFRFERIF